jgi:transketolase
MTDHQDMRQAPMNTGQAGLIEALAKQLRVDSIRCSTRAGSGHPTSSLSAADLMAVLLQRHLRYDWIQPAVEDKNGWHGKSLPAEMAGPAVAALGGFTAS